MNNLAIFQNIQSQGKKKLVRSSRSPIYNIYTNKLRVVLLNHPHEFVFMSLFAPRSSFSSHEHHELHELKGGLKW
jgi:hypothetical protein